MRRYDVAPCDALKGEGGIISHSQVPDPTNCSLGGGIHNHQDPGPTWNWGRYEGFVQRYDLTSGDNIIMLSDQSVHHGPTFQSALVDTVTQGNTGEITKSKIRNGNLWYKIGFEVEERGRTPGWAVAEKLLYTRFRPGSDIQSTSDLSVREMPGRNHDKIDTVVAGTTGKIIDGPVDNNGDRWYKINYDEGFKTGWSIGYWLMPF